MTVYLYAANSGAALLRDAFSPPASQSHTPGEELPTPTAPPMCYAVQSHSWTADPSILRTEFASSNTRQRALGSECIDTFNVTLNLDDAELAEFEHFARVQLQNGSLAFHAPYYVSDAPFIGKMQIVEGDYRVDYLTSGRWTVTYAAELIDRDMTPEQNMFEVVNAVEGFGVLWGLIQATEDAVNNNNL